MLYRTKIEIKDQPSRLDLFEGYPHLSTFSSYIQKHNKNI